MTSQIEGIEAKFAHTSNTLSAVRRDMQKQQYEQDNHRWDVLSHRHTKPGKQNHGTTSAAASEEGSFIYAVKTTGVYCLPGCSSRLPKRENVEFFDDCAQAKQAGFRACKRCEPDNGVNSMTQIIERACRLIDESDGALTLKELAREVGLSTFHLCRQFKKIVGTTTKQYAIGKRRQRLQSALEQSASVMEAICEAGYSSPSRAYDAGSNLGLCPKDYRAGGRGAVIQYGIEECTLGLVLVATTETGICCIELGDSRRRLEEALQKRFPTAAIHEGGKELSQQITDVVNIIENPHGQHASLPLDIQGTAFQMRVWNELRKLPVGTTTNYTEIARRIERPAAARAVASAIASNKIAVIIPCHRVLRKDGDLADYRWGAERKRRLLVTEQKDEK